MLKTSFQNNTPSFFSLTSSIPAFGKSKIINRMKILIAEDDTLTSKTMELCLKRDGYELICCLDGLDAMEKIELCNPDLVIVDIMLPYISGLEIIGKLKQSGNPVPIIVVSAMGQQSVMDEAMLLGADAFISKPFNIRTLKADIARLTTEAVIA
jgi:DNA-binding response OmpR family regulator